MDRTAILQNFFAKSSPCGDKRRLKAVLDCTNALFNKAKLTLTLLGRGMVHPSAKPKHCIKRVDRLLGNVRLHKERDLFYQKVSAHLLKGIKQPLILVDWSPVGHVDKQLLRASMPIGGRAISLYEAVYPESKLGSDEAHREFIKALAQVIPADCQPIIITDGGYKQAWFNAVTEQKWHWLGRVRGNTRVKTQDDSDWQSLTNLFVRATAKAQELAGFMLTKEHEHRCRGVLFKGKCMGRKHKNWSGSPSRQTDSLKHAQAAKEPWLLASNLPADQFSAQQLVGMYRKRMQIEEEFRDTKNPRLGLGLSDMASRCVKRINILVLLGSLAQFILILVGKAAYLKNYARHFQANTERCRRVLSYFYLGKEIIGDKRFDITLYDLYRAFGDLKIHYEGAMI